MKSRNNNIHNLQYSLTSLQVEMPFKVVVACGVLIQYIRIIVGRNGFRITSQFARFVWECDLTLLSDLNPALIKSLRKATFQGTVFCLLLVLICTLKYYEK